MTDPKETQLAGAMFEKLLLVCKPREYIIVADHAGFVASKACLVLRFVGWGAVGETTETPSAGGGIFPLVLDHDLYGGWLYPAQKLAQIQKTIRVSKPV
jgi:hypothetical protein